MSINKKNLVTATVTASLGLTAFACAAITPTIFGGTSVFAASTSGNVELNTEISASIAMKIVSPNDVNPNCTPEADVTYGVANRYASSTGDNSGKIVDTFNGNEGEKDELNENTSCATLSMTPNTFDSTYSDVTIFTNSPSGYALTVQSAEGATPALTNTTDSTQTIPAGALTEQDGTGEQAGQKVVPGGQNKWAYKTNNGIITDWTAMTASPAPIKAYDSYTEGGDTTRVTYGISTGSNPTGKYTTELTYTATMFDGNNPYVGQIEASETTNLTISPMSLKIAKNASKTITVTPASGYYLSGVTCPADYTCTGYVTDKDDPASTAAQTITIKNNTGSSTPASISFTVAKTAKPLSDLTYMQDMEPGTIAETATGASKTLTDSRDNRTYTVKKLNDGNIWMTQNLKLVGARTLTSADSNVTTSFNLTASNSGTWCSENSSSCNDKSMVLDSGNTSYGTYYNWYAATAGTGTYSMGNGQQATASICPKGWRLPTNSEFQTLYNNYSSASSMMSSSGPAFVLSGYRGSGSTYSQGSDGLYWSSVAYSNSNAYDLDLGSSNVNPQNRNLKWLGLTVRCVAAS